MTDMMIKANSPLATLSKLSGAIAQAQVALDVKDGGDYIKFSKGIWSANGDDEIEKSDQWALNPLNAVHGFTDFGGGKMQEKSVSIMQPKPAPADLPATLPDSENGWQDMIGIEMKGIGGDFDGEEFMFKTNSYGGKKVMSDYLKQLQVKIAAADEEIIAIVSLDSSSYNHSSYGKVHNPVFIYHGWTTVEEDDIRETAEEAPKEEEAKPARKRAAKVETVELAATEEPAQGELMPETAEEAPVRRRRRRAAA